MFPGEETHRRLADKCLVYCSHSTQSLGEVPVMAETISDRSRVPETDFGLLGMEEVRTGELVRRVGEGFPYGVLENFRENVGLSAGEVADLVQINPRTLSRRKREGRLHADESDRVLRLSRVYGKALGLFGGDLGRARRWLWRASDWLSPPATPRACCRGPRAGARARCG